MTEPILSTYFSLITVAINGHTDTLNTLRLYKK